MTDQLDIVLALHIFGIAGKFTVEIRYVSDIIRERIGNVF